MTIHKKGQAHWEGDIKRGKGTVSTESGVLNQQPYGFNTRFEGENITSALKLNSHNRLPGIYNPKDIVSILIGSYQSQSL